MLVLHKTLDNTLLTNTTLLTNPLEPKIMQLYKTMKSLKNVLKPLTKTFGNFKLMLWTPPSPPPPQPIQHSILVQMFHTPTPPHIIPSLNVLWPPSIHSTNCVVKIFSNIRGCMTSYYFFRIWRSESQHISQTDQLPDGRVQTVNDKVIPALSLSWKYRWIVHYWCKVLLNINWRIQRDFQTVTRPLV